MKKKIAAFVIVTLILQTSTVFQLQPKASVTATPGLIKNGDFSNGFVNWTVRIENGTDSYDGPYGNRPTGTGWTVVQLVNEPGRTNVLDIIQTVDDGDGDWTGVYQEINQDVSGFSALVFRAEGKAMFQSLGGDGYVGGEYPVHIIIQYQDVNGVDHDAFLGWPANPAYQVGFYYTAFGDPDGTQNPYSYLIPQNVWFSANSSNLMNLSPAPKILKTIRLYSSGWAYHGRIYNARFDVYPPPSVVSLFSDAFLILPLVVVIGTLGILRRRRRYPSTN